MNVPMGANDLASLFGWYNNNIDYICPKHGNIGEANARFQG